MCYLAIIILYWVYIGVVKYIIWEIGNTMIHMCERFATTGHSNEILAASFGFFILPTALNTLWGFSDSMDVYV